MPSPSGWSEDDFKQVYDVSLEAWVPIAGNKPWAFECRMCTNTASIFVSVDPDDPDGYWAVCSECKSNMDRFPPWLI
ncbi:MAG: hypothetical protein CL398_11680 [Acidiferrobacteraceae bacterium]|nr:hypothetical protein [Acidiferrobacteraceae bacterium]